MGWEGTRGHIKHLRLFVDASIKLHCEIICRLLLFQKGIDTGLRGFTVVLMDMETVNTLTFYINSFGDLRVGYELTYILINTVLTHYYNHSAFTSVSIEMYKNDISSPAIDWRPRF